VSSEIPVYNRLADALADGWRVSDRTRFGYTLRRRAATTAGEVPVWECAVYIIKPFPEARKDPSGHGDASKSKDKEP